MSEKEDIEKMMTSQSCIFREYEKRRLKHLTQRIEKAESELALNIDNLQPSKEMLDKIQVCVIAITSAVKVTHFLELVTVTVTFPKKELVTGKVTLKKM